MRILHFLKYSPCGNITILIKNTSLSPHERALAATEIISPAHLGAEQAGYVDTTGALPRLDMMGGEFCLNATRSLAVFLLTEGLLTPADTGWHTGKASVSGMTVPLDIKARSVSAAGGHLFEAAVLLDLPSPPTIEAPDPGIKLVRVPGIAHLVFDACRHPLPSAGEKAIPAYLRRYGLEHEEAAGCIWLHRPLSPERLSAITPFVWVRATDTIYAETACGSGTLAAALVCFQEQSDPAPLALLQPGGEALTVTPAVSRHAGGCAADVSGPVRLLAEGNVFVECLS